MIRGVGYTALKLLAAGNQAGWLLSRHFDLRHNGLRCQRSQGTAHPAEASH